MEEIKILKVDDTSFECQTLIQFSSLIKLLYKLNEKEKSLEQKIDIINQTINEKEIRLKNLEKKLEEQPKFDVFKMGQSFNFSPNNTQNNIKQEKYESTPKDITIKTNNDFDYKKKKENERELNIELNEVKNEEKEKSEIIKKEEKIEEKKEEYIEEKKEEKIEEKSVKEEKPIGDEKHKKEEKEENVEKKENIIKLDFAKEEKKDSYEIDSPRNISPDLIKNLVKRSKEYEKRIMELIKKSNEHSEFFQNIKKNHELINTNSKKIFDAQNSINDILDKFSDHKKEFADLKLKVQDFNIFDLIKSSSGNSGNIDLTKALVMNLENKVFKKFELYDERYKSYDTDIFKIKEDNKNLNNNMNVIKTQQQKYKEEVESNINELNKNLTEEINALKNQLLELQSELNDTKNKVNENNDLINNNIDSKIRQSEENIKSLIKNEIELNNKNIMDNLSKDSNSNKKAIINDNENIKDLNKKITEIQKIILSLENSIKDQKEKMQLNEDQNSKKFARLESLNKIKDKIDLLEEEINNESLKFNTIQQSYDKVRSDIANLVHKMEYLNSELAKLTLQRLSSSEKPEITIDFSKYIEKDVFTSSKNEVNNKFEKVRLAIENLGRNIESILASLGHMVNQKEMTNFQNTVKNNFDELRLNFSKKFAEKIDVNKNFKLLETQIKTISESNKKDAADNWLLAKKPMNNFLCASCESVIRGELDKRSDYIAWNKYPSREDKNYRMGHGFSKMLQMVNDDIMRSTNNDNINSNIFMNTNMNMNNNYSPNITEENNNNSNLKTIFNIYSNSKLPKVKAKNTNINTSQNLKTEGPLSFREKNKEDHLTMPLDDNSNKPKILKIHKISKNSEIQTQSANKYNNSSSVNNIHKNLLKNSQKNND